MDTIKIENFSAQGLEAGKVEIKETGEVGFEISNIEFDKIFNEHFNENNSALKMQALDQNMVCFKQTITKMEHPFQTKIEWDWIEICVPIVGCYKDKVRPRPYRRSVTYVIFAEICYPTDLIIKHVENCAKQGAVAASAIAITGSKSAALAAFQAAFFACMTLADFPNSDKIKISIGGDTIHGDWKAV
jgi:hypothetical protein